MCFDIFFSGTNPLYFFFVALWGNQIENTLAVLSATGQR